MLLENICKERRQFNASFAFMSLKFSTKIIQLKQDIEKSSNSVFANGNKGLIFEAYSSSLFGKTQTSNFKKNTSHSSMLCFETNKPANKKSSSKDPFARNEYLKLRLKQTEETGLSFIEELDTMMSLFIKKNEKLIYKKFSSKT